MEFRRIQNIKYLQSILTDKQIRQLYMALKENKVIIIKGKQGMTGKSTLKKVLQEKGYRAYEGYETFEIELNKSIKNPVPNLKIE